MRSVLNIVIGLALLGSACGGDDGGGGGDVDASAPDANSTPDATAIDAKPVGNACDRVDIVFTVDGSASMREEVEQLSGTVFPMLITKLRELAGGTEDYRVAVLDACPTNANFHTVRTSMDPDNLEGDPCNFESGQVWMNTESSMLSTEFSCVSNIYTDDYDESGVIGEVCVGGSQDDDEQPAKTIIAALSPENLAAGGANEGFLRDNALLLMVAITDEDETPFDGAEVDGEDAYVQSLYDDLVAIKGNVDKMVFMGIGGSTGCRDADGYGAGREARRLNKLTNLFIAEERGVLWDLCEGDLVDGLAEAMKVITATCNQVQ